MDTILDAEPRPQAAELHSESVSETLAPEPMPVVSAAGLLTAAPEVPPAAASDNQKLVTQSELDEISRQLIARGAKMAEEAAAKAEQVAIAQIQTLLPRLESSVKARVEEHLYNVAPAAVEAQATKSGFTTSWRWLTVSVGFSGIVLMIIVMVVLVNNSTMSQIVASDRNNIGVLEEKISQVDQGIGRNLQQQQMQLDQLTGSAKETQAAMIQHDTKTDLAIRRLQRDLADQRRVVQSLQQRAMITGAITK